jgi:hypothetical protein
MQNDCTYPVGEVDPLGLASCYVLFPKYPITYNDAGDRSTRLGGHAGVLIYDDQGRTRYYEYGRYEPTDKYAISHKLPAKEGNIRRIPVRNLKIGENNEPTQESIGALEEQLSQRAGHNTEVKMTCNKNSDPAKVNAHLMSIADNPDRDKYKISIFAPWTSNHCRTFAKDAVAAGE